MSDGMAFLTGAAFAGVAVLFMLKGGGNLGATNLPVSQQLPVSPATNPSYNPYLTPPQSPIPASPDPALYGNDQQRLENDRLKAMLDQQRSETEQLKAQLQSQQMLIERLSGQSTNPTASPTWSKPLTNAPQNQQQQPENSVLSGIVWGLGGMAVTISGGLVVVGALAVLSRQQQRPARTTYVVQQPYTALPPSVVPRRRAEVITPVEERHIDYVDYER